MVKRVVDILVASLLLLLAMPLLLTAALLIALTSPGPVLFRQTRMGRGYQPFEILKLRTMRHAEAGLAYTLGPDPRITSLGRLLRRTKLDELPQLWNVIRGEMSLVGPRPVLPELTYEFCEFYFHLLRARPGLTDPASLKYSQETRLLEQAEDAMDFFKRVVTPDKVRISVAYMDRANLWTDLATMAMTAAICCFPKLSRRYGELPEVSALAGAGHAKVAPVEVEPPKFTRSTPPLVGLTVATDGSIFSHRLAELEATMEEEAVGSDLPWIRLPDTDFEPRSVPLVSKGSGSRLQV